MKQGDMGIPDIQALVRFGAVGVQMFMARILSVIALVGFFALAFYVVYPPASWIGAVVCGIAALVLISVLRAERPLRAQPGGSNVETTQ